MCKKQLGIKTNLRKEQLDMSTNVQNKLYLYKFTESDMVSLQIYKMQLDIVIHGRK